MRQQRNRTAGLASFMLAALVVSGSAGGQEWPAKPCRIVVNTPAGGANDIFARLIAQRLAVRLGQPFLVENRAGANGNIGMDAVAEAAPDGYTIGFSTSGPLAQNRFLYMKMPYDPDRDFAPLILVGEIPLVALANNAVQARNLKELADLARANPGKLNVGSAGNGAVNHLTIELFNSIAKVKLQHVPFKGSPTAELMAGAIQLLFDPIPTSAKYVKAGSLKGLGIFSRARSPLIPAVPTAIEQGFDIEASVYYPMVGPAGMPRAIVDRLNQEINQYLNMPEARAKFGELGVQVIGGPPERVTAMIESESKKWKRVVESTGVRFD